MFRPTSPQRSMFAVEHQLDATKRARLERSWAHEYRAHALPLIDEARFAKYFDAGNGRPNKSVQQVVSVLVLKERFDLTDEQALEELEWNTAWHYALDVLPEDAHTCQKTLHNFRALLLGDDEGAGLFESTTARLIEAPRRLEQTALDVHSLVCRFEEHKVVAVMESFGLLARLYTEQCVPPASKAPDKVELQEKPSSASLQSPADPDATYGHKGKGYEVQLTETCDEQNPFQVVTSVEVNGANESDQHHVVPALEQIERTCGETPETMHADAGYASGENIVAAQERGTDMAAPIEQRGYGNSATRLAFFTRKQCSGCPIRSQCPVTKTRSGKRVLRFRATEVAVTRRRIEQETPQFKQRHKLRSGIEATNSELKPPENLVGQPLPNRLLTP